MDIDSSVMIAEGWGGVQVEVSIEGINSDGGGDGEKKRQCSGNPKAQPQSRNCITGIPPFIALAFFATQVLHVLQTEGKTLHQQKR